MLDREYFKDNLDKIQEQFNRKYQKQALTMIYEFVSHLTTNEFNKIIKHIIASHRVLPVPINFKELARSERCASFRNGEVENVATFIYSIKCENCLDSGHHRIEYNPEEFCPLVCCDCPKGGEESMYWVGLPRWDKSFDMLFKRKPINYKAYIPKKGLNQDDVLGSLQEKVNLFKNLVNQSVEFWRVKKETHEMEYRETK